MILFVCDQQFASEYFTLLWVYAGVKMTTVATFHRSINGKVERYKIRFVSPLELQIAEDEKDWDIFAQAL